MNYNKKLDKIGLAIYHTGIEINGSEYAYGGNALLDSSGVYEMRPKKHDVFLFRQSIEVKDLKLESMEVVYKVLPGIMKKFKANKYNMLRFNCNHFSDEFLRKISKEKQRLPAYLNRPANIGGKVHCLIPIRYLIVIPPGTSEEEV